MCKTIFLLTVVIVCLSVNTQAAEVPRTKPILDEQGRHVIPGGYVTITSDRCGEVTYQPEDYHRMVRMGANFVVLRIGVGQLGGYPGRALKTDYLEKLDSMVEMAKGVGLKTQFKMVFYGPRDLSGDGRWDVLWNDTNGAQDKLLACWKHIWKRYKNEPFVFGYDLLNEPETGSVKDEDYATRKLLLPLLRRLTDAMHAISPEKWALYQPFNQINKVVPGPCLPINEPFGRDRVIYAPHSYNGAKVFKNMMDRFQREAVESDTPLMLGEWGQQTELRADNDPALQKKYTELYEFSANILDTRGFGGIKAWFTGSRAPINKAGKETFTWAIFSDDSATGKVERKFITDVIVRTRPLVVAGRIEHYQYDFDTRTFTMRLRPNAKRGSSELFIPLERHYPEGAYIEIGPGLTLALPPGATRLRGIKGLGRSNHDQGRAMRWDADSQKLIIGKWKLPDRELTVKIRPTP